MKITINTEPTGMARWTIHTTEEVLEEDLIDILKNIVGEMEELIKTEEE